MNYLEAQGLVAHDTKRIILDGNFAVPKLNRRGELCVIDFYTQMAMEKRGFELRAGTDSDTETGDAPIATTVAELAVNAGAGLTMIPVFFNVGITTNIGTATRIELKCINVASSGGTARTPLPLWTDSTIAAVSTGLMNDTGGVTVSADATTTTNVLYLKGGAVALGAYQQSCQYQPLLPVICAGLASVYAQIGATDNSPEYHATLHYIEIPTTALE